MTDLFKQRTKDWMEEYLDFSSVQIVNGYIPDITIQSGIHALVAEGVFKPSEITEELKAHDVVLPINIINEWSKDKRFAN